MIILSPSRDYPPRWSTYCNHIGTDGPSAYGFHGSIADINRYAARYRAAKCFRQVVFDGVNKDTADGYSALCHILLTYSAFEHLLKCLGISKDETQTLLSRDERDRLQSRLRGLKGQRELFIVIHALVNHAHRAEIDKHVSGQRCNPFYLASSIRHSFAHGVLAATPVKAPEKSVATISRFFVRVLFLVMDREFERRIKYHEDYQTKYAK